MQIKRFEAADMTEALRMVKREFGDDAVILSAKEVRPRGFFSALKKKHVEITAATDYPAEDSAAGNEFTGLLARQLDEISASDRVSLSTPAVQARPLSSKGKPVSPPKPLMDDRTADKSNGNGMHQGPPARPAATSIFDEKRMASANRRWADLNTGVWCAQPFYFRPAGRKIIALVGPSGAGKSTALAKLAWHCQESEKQHVGLISLDRYRMAANSALERFAEIMQLPLYVAQDADELQSALRELDSVDTVLIDTPGMGPDDRSMLAAVRRLLDAAHPDETHLVVNATVRKKVLVATARTYDCLNPDHILFTHMDEYGADVSLFDLLESLRQPLVFLSDSVNLNDDLKTTAAGDLQSTMIIPASDDGRITVFPGNKGSRSVQSADHRGGVGSARYLANRNSELFHDPACKSVKRINTENIIAFDSMEQALSRGFKPCRACCDIDTIRKLVMEGAGVRRAGAM